MQHDRIEPTPVVMKFGGSSVADLERLRHVAARVAQRAREMPVVVVVSAMGGSTDALVNEARDLCGEPPARELDMLLTTGERRSMALLALAICERGLRAISLTGSQVGIITDHRHGQARVVEVRPFRILDELAGGHDVVIVGGFQGVSYKREVTTLGRGGSDTTAVALAASLGADCEIYSDVDGVYSADPRLVPESTRIDEIDYAAMQAMSRAGAKVLHAQAVAIAARAGIVIYARSTADDGANTGQTMIRRNPRPPTGVLSVAQDDVCAIEITFAEPPTDLAALVLAAMTLGLVFPRVTRIGLSALCSTRQRDDLAAVLARLGDALERSGAAVRDVDLDEGCALVSGVGHDLESRDDLTAAGLDALATAAIAVRGAYADMQTLAFLVPRPDGAVAVRALHRALVEDAAAAGAQMPS